MKLVGCCCLPSSWVTTESVIFTISILANSALVAYITESPYSVLMESVEERPCFTTGFQNASLLSSLVDSLLIHQENMYRDSLVKALQISH